MKFTKLSEYGVITKCFDTHKEAVEFFGSEVVPVLSLEEWRRTPKDLVLVTINFEEKRADYVWYNPNNPAPMNNPANHLSEDMDYEEALELYQEYTAKA